MVLRERIELSTSPLPRECSTTELPQLNPCRRRFGLAGRAVSATGRRSWQAPVSAGGRILSQIGRESLFAASFALRTGPHAREVHGPGKQAHAGRPTAASRVGDGGGEARKGPARALGGETGRKRAARRSPARESAPPQGPDASAPGRNARPIRAARIIAAGVCAALRLAAAAILGQRRYGRPARAAGESERCHHYAAKAAQSEGQWIA